MTRLGINVDHVATLRQARREPFPDPTDAALAAIRGGADGITAHLREDRRHIQDADIRSLKEKISVPLNLEMAATPELVRIAQRVKPAWACLVPEKRHELTTEGGLDVVKHKKQVAEAVRKLNRAGTQVSLFIEARENMVRAAEEIGAQAVELHTGHYAKIWPKPAVRQKELERIVTAAEIARELELTVNAGHGITYDNVRELLRAFSFDELNIGFVIVARSVAVGMETAVREMKTCVAS